MPRRRSGWQVWPMGGSRRSLEPASRSRRARHWPCWSGWRRLHGHVDGFEGETFMSVLSEILATKRTDVAHLREKIPFARLQEQLIDAAPPLDFKAALQKENETT